MRGLILRFFTWVISCGAIYAGTPDSLTISEVMFTPASGSANSEFVELYNYGSTPIDLAGWRLRDNLETDTLQSFGGGTILLPGRFAVIVESDYDTITGIYHGLIPPEALIMRVDDNTIGNGLGNSGDSIRIIRAIGDTVSRYVYSLTNPAGISDEKIVLTGSQSTTNWANSLSQLGTPGFRNSVSPAEYDVSIATLRFLPATPSPHDPLILMATIRNEGLTSISAFDIMFFEDPNGNFLWDSGEWLDSLSHTTPLAAGDSLFAQIESPPLNSGWHRMIAEVVRVIPGDDSPANDRRLDSVYVRTAGLTDSITFSEVMFDPAGPESSDEFIEFFNYGSQPVDLLNWTVGDTVNSDQIIDAGMGTVLLPGQFGVLFDSNYDIPTGSYAEAIPANAVVLRIDGSTFGGSSSGLTNTVARPLFLISTEGDTVSDYRYSTGNAENQSDEKIDLRGDNTSLNWGNGTLGGGTPGYTNSISPVGYDAAVDSDGVHIYPAIPERGQPFSAALTVYNRGLLPPSSSIAVYLYEDFDLDFTSSPEELVDSSIVSGLADSTVVTFDRTPHPDDASMVRLLFTLTFSEDERPSNNMTAKTVFIGTPRRSVVINEILYSPSSGQPEFVEIYNRSGDVQNLKHWKVGDESSSKPVTAADHFMASGTFRVLTGDSAAFSRLPAPDSVIIVIDAMPAFNNDDDGVVLQDDVGTTLDSVHYFSSWGGRTGVSLERVSSDASSQNPGNWASSVAAGGSTPGLVNGVITIQPEPVRSMVINEIMYSPFSGENEYVELFNPSNRAVDLGGWSLQVGSSKSYLSVATLMVPPGGFRVVADSRAIGERFALADSLWMEPVDALPALSNEGTMVVLRDPVGAAIDSLSYAPSWGGGAGIALERKRSTDIAAVHGNWNSCVFEEGGTPGAVNSVVAGTTPRKIQVTANPNPFFVDEGDLTIISVDLPVTMARMTVRIYDNQGRPITTLLNNAPTGAHREIHWDGKDRNGRPARMGIYVIFVEAIEEISGFARSAKATVVVGRKL